MNRFTARTFILVFCLLLPCMALALPGPHDPMTGGNGYTCQNCHTGTATIGATNWDNVCLICHNGSTTTSPTNGNRTIQPFGVADYADPFNAGDARASKYQTSHKWTGSDVNPQAGALAPTDKWQTTNKGMNKSNLVGSVTCARCHNIHGTSGAQSQVKPYLRSPNDNDQMCLDCHRTRDHASQTFGTHPVNVDYAATAAAKPDKYYATPQNAFANNSTTAIKLISGKIQCSSCHGVHYTDSGKSGLEQTATNYNNLSTANGGLLRTKLRVNTIGEIGLCTNCHKAKDHNGASQGIQCSDCHTGHVEYDKTAVTAQEKMPNLFLLKRFINVSTSKGAVRNKKVLFTSMTSASYYSATAGVCTACHAAPSTHISDGRAANNCTTSCHTHASTTGSGFSGGCSSCHGYPPTTNTAGGASSGYAVDAANGYNYSTSSNPKNEASSGHKSHAVTLSYSCDECHLGRNHDTGTFTDVFTTKVGIKASTNGANPTYTAAGNGTCSTSYCHSNGNAANMKYKSVNWGLAQTTYKISGTAIECVSCHNGVISGFNNMSSNSHFKHVSNIAASGRGLGCAVCHATTVSSNTVVSNAGNHVNGVRNVSFGAGQEIGTTWSGATCSTSYCHSNGSGVFSTPTWSNRPSGQCGTCHGTASGTLITTNAHSAHLTVIGGTDPLVVCTKCHTYTGELAATHINGTKQVTAGCATNLCHGTIANPAWTASTGNDTCTKCHGTGTPSVSVANRHVVAPSLPAGSDTGKVSVNAKTGAHQTHLLFSNGLSAYGTEDTRCVACHGALPTGNGSHANGSSTPVFQGLAVAGGMASASFSGGSCSSTYCHNPGASTVLTSGNTGTGIAPSWTNPAYIADGTLKTQANCGMCHKSPGDSGFPTVKYDHGVMTIANDCAGCHGHNGSGVQHIDGVLVGSSSCNICHGYPPVADMTGLGVTNNFKDAALATQGGGGHHTTHLLATVVQGDGFTPCLPCHPSGYHNQGGGVVAKANVNVNDPTDLTFRFDSSRTKRYDSAAKTCSNVSCHFQPTPAW